MLGEAKFYKWDRLRQKDIFFIKYMLQYLEKNHRSDFRKEKVGRLWFGKFSITLQENIDLSIFFLFNKF